MGTKLCNLNIYNPEKKAYELEAGYSVVHIADGWDTILEEEMVLNYNKMARIARRLSKELDSPAITVNYFDDDVFMLDIYKDGKKAAYQFIEPGTINLVWELMILVVCLSTGEKQQ